MPGDVGFELREVPGRQPARLTCENQVRVDTGAPCTRRAAWLVGVGSRVTDRQASCGDCLAFTCASMVSAEGRDTVRLTLIPL